VSGLCVRCGAAAEARSEGSPLCFQCFDEDVGRVILEAARAEGGLPPEADPDSLSPAKLREVAHEWSAAMLEELGPSDLAALAGDGSPEALANAAALLAFKVQRTGRPAPPAIQAFIDQHARPSA